MIEEIKKEPIGVAVACKKYFGFKEGQTVAAFATEIHALSVTEKQEFAVMLSKELNTEVIVK